MHGATMSINACMHACIHTYIHTYIHNNYTYRISLLSMAQDRDRWRTLVSAVMNLRVPWNLGNFLTSCKPVSFSRRTLHHGVSNWLIWRCGCICYQVLAGACLLHCSEPVISILLFTQFSCASVGNKKNFDVVHTLFSIKKVNQSRYRPGVAQRFPGS